jgi:hypothetical protein
LNRGSRFCSLKKGLDRRQRNARKLPCSKAIGLSHELAGHGRNCLRFRHVRDNLGTPFKPSS